MPVLASPGWLVAAILAAGLWLTARLYLAPPRRPGLALAMACAWILLALLLASPRMPPGGDAWHPPRVVLAVDDCPGYAALGARDSAVVAAREAGRHFRSRGFRVDSVAFSSCGIDAAGRVLQRTGLDGLRAALRAAGDAPNLQGILLWSDGRFPADADGGDPTGRLEAGVHGAWPAPVFPVAVRPAPEAMHEAQGEGIRVDVEDGVPVVTVEWRSGGGSRAARLEWHDTARGGAGPVWRAALEPMSGARAGERQAAVLEPPAPARAMVMRGEGRALVRGMEDAMPRNDTVAVVVRGEQGPFHHMVAPLVDLDERAFLDALAATSGATVRVSVPDSVIPRQGDVVWIRADRKDGGALEQRARAAGAVVVRYRLPGRAGAASSPVTAFDASARTGHASGGEAWLPAAAARLADIGAGDGAWLRADDGTVAPLAWANDGTRRGLLSWREADGARGVVLLPRWSAMHRDDAGERATARAWARGIAEWARLQDVVQVRAPERVVAGRAFHVLVRVPEDAGSVRLSSAEGSVASGVPAGSGWARFEVPGLRRGVQSLALHAAGVLAWSGTVRVADPLDAAHARLLRDVELLEALARASGGNVLAAGDAWPSLPEAQVRAESSAPRPVVPFLPALVALALLLACVWAWRKRARLD